MNEDPEGRWIAEAKGGRLLSFVWQLSSHRLVDQFQGEMELRSAELRESIKNNSSRALVAAGQRSQAVLISGKVE